MKKEILEQAVLDYINEKFKDKVLDKRVQTFFTYSELVDTVLSFAELLNKNIEELEKENAELRSRDCWKSCEYANPKAELMGQHIKDVQKLTKAKYTLEKIIETVQNDRIDEYGARLVLIKDFAYECLEEIENEDEGVRI